MARPTPCQLLPSRSVVSEPPHFFLTLPLILSITGEGFPLDYSDLDWGFGSW